MYGFDDIVFEKINYKEIHKNTSYSTNYHIFRTDEVQKIPSYLPNEPMETTSNNTACYSGLLGRLKLEKIDDKPCNRVYTRIELFPPWNKKQYPLTYEDQCAWIKLAKKFKLLPYYVTHKVLVKSKDDLAFANELRMTINLDGINFVQLYIYLATLRNLKDEPGFVKALLYLYYEIKMNFYAAYVLSLHLNNPNSGHSVVSASDSFYCNSKPVPYALTDKINLKRMIGLHRFLIEPKAYDTRTFNNIAKAGNWYWECDLTIAKTVQNIAEKEAVVNIKDLFNKHIIKAIMSLDDKSFKKEMKRFKDDDTKID